MEINKDFVASVIIKDNGQLEYVEIKIPKRNQHILSKMKDMCENPNRTILDLQEIAASLIISKEEHNVCLPYEYYATYIHAPKLPENISFADYSKMCNEKKNELLKEKDDAEEKGEPFDVERELEKFISMLKYNYMRAISDYVDADEYMAVFESVKCNDTHKMYSSENIGWTTFIYPISDNVKFEVRTNFGYGRSAYFRVNLLYKGIQIIPYSDVVKYYFANMHDLCQFTRQYRPRRESWQISLNFVVETTNLAHANPEQFVKTWIKNELEEMMKGLRRLNDNVKAEIENFEKTPNPSADHFICVRNINHQDIQDYKAYPKEMAAAYKAYKISGALNFLDNLSQLSEVYTFVGDYISELKQINMAILPEIEIVISNIENTLTELRGQLDALKSKKEAIEKKMEPFIKTLEGLKEKKDSSLWWSITDNFKKLNPQYCKMIDEKEEIQKRINEITYIIYKRENFKQNLEESRKLIIEKATN